MPSTKEALLKQTLECRRRLEQLAELKRDVAENVDNACRRISGTVAEAENVAEIGDELRIKAMIRKIDNAWNKVGEYEKELEGVRVIHDNDRELSAATDRVDELLAKLGLSTTDQSISSNRLQQMDFAGAAGDGVFFENGSTIENEVVGSTDGIAQEFGTAVVDRQFRSENKIGSVYRTQTTVDSGIEIDTINVVEEDRRENGEIATVFLDNEAIGVGVSNVAIQFPMSSSGQAAFSSTIGWTTAESDDYRKQVVGKGNGNADEFCQRSVALTASGAEGLKCTVSHVENPSLFWIRLSNHCADTMENDLNMALDSESTALPNPKVNDYCVAPTEDDDDNEDTLRRAKILEIKNNSSGTPFAKILYIDTGKVDWVATKSLLELPRRFRYFQRQACPCVLVGIEPKSGFWDEESISTFRQLVSSNDNSQLFVKSLDQGEASDINTVSLSRINNASKAETTVLFSLMVAGKGKLQRIEKMVPMKSFGKEGGESIGGNDPPDESDGWRCVSRTTENKATNAATVSTQNIGSNQAGPSLLAKNCVKVATPIVQGSVPKIALSKLTVSADGLPENQLCFRMTRIISPSEFHIQILDERGRNDDLDRLTDGLTDFYSISGNQKLLHKPDPQYATVRWSIDGRTAFRRIYITEWQVNPCPRFETRDFRVNSTVTAFFVDYGYRERLDTKDVFVLDKRFCSLPAQSALCTLYDCHSNTRNGIWTPNALDIFGELTKNSKPLMKGAVLSEAEPFELVVLRTDAYGTESCINKSMVESRTARSNTEW